MTKGGPCAAIAMLLLAVTSSVPAAQDDVPGFDVASIKLNRETAGSSQISPRPNGQFVATAATPRDLILRAYALHESQVIGGPDWIAEERFDIDARAAAPPLDGPQALMPMVRTLLAERFRLRVHDSTRELSAFLLTHARRDARLGPQLHPTKADCSATRSTPTELELRASALNGWPPCGQQFVVSFTTGGPDGVAKIRIRRSAVYMEDFARSLQGTLGRPVVDRTGLEGRWDIEYSYAPRPAADVPGVAENLPSLGAALEEQLGLKLESARTDVPVLVIDAIERPTPD